MLVPLPDLYAADLPAPAGPRSRRGSPPVTVTLLESATVMLIWSPAPYSPGAIRTLTIRGVSYTYRPPSASGSPPPPPPRGGRARSATPPPRAGRPVSSTRRLPFSWNSAAATVTPADAGVSEEPFL